MKAKKTLTIKDKTEPLQLFKIAKFKQEIRKTHPHKHNGYFEIIYLSRGSGSHFIDSQEYTIKPPIVFFIRNEQVHHWDISSEPDGYVIILKKDYLKTVTDSELKHWLQQARLYSVIPLNSPDTLDALMRLMIEFSQSSSATEGFLKALLAILLTTPPKPTPNENPGNDLFTSFLEQLSKTSTLRNRVQYYAEILHTTPQNLSITCKNHTGQSATEIIADYIISEAKRLLTYTSSTVAEISLVLHFSDASHFTKYFKRHTGFTPQAYRNLERP